MVLTVTEDTPADMLAGSMELLVQLPRDHHLQTQKVTVQRSMPMMDLLVQIATAHKLTASSYTLQAIGERGMVLPHQPNTPIGALDALQVKLLPKQGTFIPRKAKQVNQPFETTFRLQVHLPRNQLWVSRVSPKMNLGEILEQVCREKGLDKNKYELRHPTNLETLDLSLALQDYHLQEVTLYAKQGRTLGSALSTQDIMALQRQEERRRQQARQGVFGFVFKKSKEGSLSTDSLGGRSASPARSDETGRSISPLQPPTRPQRKRRPAPKPPAQAEAEVGQGTEENSGDSSKDKVVISHSRNSSDSSGYHEASVLSDNPDSAGRLPETLPRRNKVPLEMPRKLAQTSQSSKSLSNLASVPGTLSHGISSTSLSSTGLRKKRVAPPPPVTRPLSSAISTQALERIVDSEESLTSDMDPSKPPSDIGASSKANSDIEERPKASSDIGVTTIGSKLSSSIDFAKPDGSKAELESNSGKCDREPRHRSGSVNVKLSSTESGHPTPVEDAPVDSRLPRKRVGEPVPLPKPRKAVRPEVLKRRLAPPSPLSRTTLNSESSYVDCLSNVPARPSTGSFTTDTSSNLTDGVRSSGSFVGGEEILEVCSNCTTSEDEVFMTPEYQSGRNFNYYNPVAVLEGKNETELTDNNTDDRANNERKLNINEDQESVEASSIDDGAIEERKSSEASIEASSTSDEADDNRKLSINESEVNVEACSDQNSTLVRTKRDSVDSTKSVSGEEKKLCAVIFTMPKCDHLSSLSVKDTLAQGKEWEPKKARIPRTASKSNDFEVNTLERQKRHLTSHAEDITFALNLNVNPNLLPDQLREFDTDLAQRPQLEEQDDIEFQGVGGEKSSCVAVGSSDANLSETDVLLQKVSDTLSNSLPSSETPVLPVETKSEPLDVSKKTDEKSKKNVEYPKSFDVNTSSPNLTVNSQQDTSDYVSAADEDLSVTDWEYQLPAPPSAFRDPGSPVFDNFEVIPPSPESFRGAETNELVSNPSEKDRRKITEKIDKQGKDTTPTKSSKQPKLESGMRKEVICELENKIGALPQKDVVDFRRLSNPSTPKIAPVDNTLSNFTITTYSKQKNLNIFEKVEQSRENQRFVKSFATLSRNRSNSNEDKNLKEFSVGTSQGKKNTTLEEDQLNEKKLEPKIRTESLQRWQSGNEKSNIQRSKSYVSVCDKPNFRGNVHEDESVKNEKNLEMDDVEMKKATSISNLNAAPTKTNEKWRDNILKRPTKEKQLQSVQVLKSILPQLKNAQLAEENVPKDSNDTVLSEKTRSETMPIVHSIESNAVPSRESQTAPSNKDVEPESKRPIPETNTKRYTYSGPPMINLGSWSERPSVNVQIKMDTDYKFGVKQTSNRTIVNISDSKDEVDFFKDADSSTKIQKSKFEIIEKKEPNDLTKKLITHTTAIGFKKPALNKVNSSEPKVTNDRPVVTAVELKKSFLENKQDDSVIDTTPVNFKELTKAFGQDVCIRAKPKRASIISRSNSQLESDTNKQNGHNLDQCLTNGHQNNVLKRFTSVVGIQGQSQGNLTFRNDTNAKGSQPLPVVKGFKISNAKIDGGQRHESHVSSMKEGGLKEVVKEDGTKGSSKDSNGIPRPPTMPVITGVTLKSARPKSMPIQIDQRDILLESIRNFGGRENLKSAAGRC